MTYNTILYQRRPQILICGAESSGMIDGMEMCASVFRITGASVLLHGVAFAIHTYA